MRVSEMRHVLAQKQVAVACMDDDWVALAQLL